MVSESKRRKARANDDDWKVSAKPDRERPTPAKKDTKRWCRGRVGREHMPVVTIPKNTPGECGEMVIGHSHRQGSIDWKTYWLCRHVLQCTECEKQLKTRVPCPANHQKLPQWL